MRQPNRGTYRAFSGIAVAAGAIFGGCSESKDGTPPPSLASRDGATETPDALSSPDGSTSTPGPADGATATPDTPNSSDRETYNAIWGADDDDIWAFGV